FRFGGGRGEGRRGNGEQAKKEESGKGAHGVLLAEAFSRKAGLKAQELRHARSLEYGGQGRFPGYRVTASLPTFPGFLSRGRRVAAPYWRLGERARRLQWRDRAGFRPASLLPSRSGRHPDVMPRSIE